MGVIGVDDGVLHCGVRVEVVWDDGLSEPPSVGRGRRAECHGPTGSGVPESVEEGEVFGAHVIGTSLSG